MKTFVVEATETRTYNIRVEANDEIHAIEIVEGYSSGDGLPYETSRKFEVWDVTEQ